VTDENDRRFLQEHVGDDLLACLGHSDRVRAREQGRRTGDLEPEHLQALDRSRAFVDARSRDWETFQRQAIEFHLHSVHTWANHSTGQDPSTQIDPDLRHGPAALSDTPPPHTAATNRRHGDVGLSHPPHTVSHSPPMGDHSTMSLNVAPALLTQAEQGEIREDDFVATVRDSLPYAYNLVADLAGRLKDGDAEFADNHTPPPSETERGQLLRALASNSIRGSLERHFGVTLAFMNCHRVAAFRPGAETGETYAKFTSARSQILNQSPEFRDC
jgi:NucS shadow ORF